MIIRYITCFVIVLLQSCLHWYFVMYYQSPILLLFVDGLSVIFGHICAPVMLRYISGVQMDLSITRLFVSKKSKHTLITPHGIGYPVWSSLTPSLLRLSRTVLVDTYHWSVLSVFIRRVRFIWSCFMTFTNKIALSSKYAFSAIFNLKWHF